MAKRDVIAIGASAGGVEALVQLAAGLPPKLDAAIFVVLHLPTDATSHLAHILSRAGRLDAVHPEDGERFQHGRIYVAPPNHHVLLADGHIRLSVGPHINGVRPAIDALFQSAARAYGQRTIGVVLSGTLRDGTLGLDVIKLCGGIAVVQDPDEARFSSMPRSALEHIPVDYCLPVAQMPSLLLGLTGGSPDESPEVSVATMCSDPTNDSNIGRQAESDTLGQQPSIPTHLEKQYDEASGLSCPNCNGSVWELRDGTQTRIECRVGHAFSVEAFMGEQAVALEAALWSAINSLQERATTLRRFADRLATASRQTAVDYEQRAREIERQAALLREGLMRVIQVETAPDS